MPNHVTNIIRVKNRIEEFKEKFIKLNEDGNEYFDFNEVVPISSDLDIRSGSGSYLEDEKETLELRELLCRTECQNLTQSEFVNLIKDKVKKNNTPIGYLSYHDNLDTFIKGYYNIKTYGYRDWYNANIDKWGTKWNAYNCAVTENNDDLVIIFDTAWSTPEPIIQELCKQGFNFTCIYADEDLGFNLGIFESLNGELSYTDLQEEKDMNRRYLTSLFVKNNCVPYGDDLEGMLETYDYMKEIDLETIEEVSNELDYLLA